MVIIPDKDPYLSKLLLGIKDGIRDSIICEVDGKEIYIPDDYNAGYELGDMIIKLYKHVQSISEA